MPYPNTHTTRYQAGFTLIELMVSITLGLGILAGLVGVLSANSYNARSNERTSDLVTNGRFALNLLKQELRQAGFRGYTWADPSTPLALGTLTNECLQTGATAGSFVSNLRQGIWGANNTNPFSSTCIPETSFADGNDVFVIRRVEAIPTTPSKANTLYFLSSYAQGQMFRGTTAPTFINNPEPLASFEVKAYVYYISPFTVSGETTQIPALWRVALDDSARMQPELVASGIEHMHIQYGVHNLNTQTTQYLDTLSGTSHDSGLTDWDSVNSVRIWLLARSETIEAGYTNKNIYEMGDTTYDFSGAPDGYRRQLFSAVVQLRN